MTWLKKLVELEGRLAQWAIALQAYDYYISYRSRSAHQNAICLSLLPTIAIVSFNDDCLYDMLLQPGKWKDETLEIQSSLKRIAKVVIMKDSQMNKNLNGIVLPFIRPLPEPI